MNADKIKSDNQTAPDLEKTSPAQDAPLATKPEPTEKASDTVPRERNGPKGPEPTRYGDWEQKGRCTDF
jgi:hypothetical protein